MKKLTNFIAPIKSFAAQMLAGLIILYMVTGVLYASATGADFEYNIPFIFILQGIALTMMIALLRELILGDIFIKKWRFFKRILTFCILLKALFAISFFVFFSIPTSWAYLWLIAIGVLMFGTTLIFGLSEMYYRKTGEWYTEILRVYKENQ
ncbi:MAG: hypothetical protein FWE29_06235 [Defluviitaleaceae bacterium]|nr:hypothetical protein [Defluviitaleaceae bacterium]